MWNHFFSYGNYPYGNYPYRSSYTASSSSSSRNLRVVNPDPGDTNAGAVCAIATVANVSYAKAWNTALEHGFSSSVGMVYSEIKATLSSLGVSCTYYNETPSWDDLPDFAMITVHGSDRVHAVVFSRQAGGEELIYDSRERYPVGRHGYTIDHDDGYLKIHGQSSSSSPPPSPARPPSSSPARPRFSSSNLRIVKQDPSDGAACGICAIAVASGASYRAARRAAIDNGWDSEDGMNKEEMQAALSDLGVSSTYYDEAPGWDDLDDLAIISINSGGVSHAVVFERRADGREYIYDNHKHYPVAPAGYTLIRANGYLRINRGTGGPYA